MFLKHSHTHLEFDANGVAPNKKGQFPYEAEGMSMIALLTHHHPVQLKAALATNREKFGIQGTRVRDMLNDDSNKQKKQEKKEKEKDNISENKEVKATKPRKKKQAGSRDKSEISEKSQVASEAK